MLDLDKAHFDWELINPIKGFSPPLRSHSPQSLVFWIAALAALSLAPNIGMAKDQIYHGTVHSPASLEAGDQVIVGDGPGVLADNGGEVKADATADNPIKVVVSGKNDSPGLFANKGGTLDLFSNQGGTKTPHPLMSIMVKGDRSDGLRAWDGSHITASNIDICTIGKDSSGVYVSYQFSNIAAR
jgi:hypothetical protein